MNVDRVIIRYSTDGESGTQVPEPVDITMAQWGSFAWLIPDEVSDRRLVRILDYDGGDSVESRAVFSILPRPAEESGAGDAGNVQGDLVGVLGCAQAGRSESAGLLLLLILVWRRRRRG